MHIDKKTRLNYPAATIGRPPIDYRGNDHGTGGSKGDDDDNITSCGCNAPPKNQIDPPKNQHEHQQINTETKREARHDAMSSEKKHLTQTYSK